MESLDEVIVLVTEDQLRALIAALLEVNTEDRRLLARLSNLLGFIEGRKPQ